MKYGFNVRMVDADTQETEWQGSADDLLFVNAEDALVLETLDTLREQAAEAGASCGFFRLIRVD